MTFIMWCDTPLGHLQSSSTITDPSGLTPHSHQGIKPGHIVKPPSAASSSRLLSGSHLDGHLGDVRG